jgi:hypothetical protein
MHDGLVAVQRWDSRRSGSHRSWRFVRGTQSDLRAGGSFNHQSTGSLLDFLRSRQVGVATIMRQGPGIEIVCHDRAIKFGVTTNFEDEVLIAIPLDEDKLVKSLMPDDDKSTDCRYRFERKPWRKRYRHEDHERGVGWILHILDNIKRAISG